MENQNRRLLIKDRVTQAKLVKVEGRLGEQLMMENEEAWVWERQSNEW